MFTSWSQHLLSVRLLDPLGSPRRPYAKLTASPMPPTPRPRAQGPRGNPWGPQGGPLGPPGGPWGPHRPENGFLGPKTGSWDSERGFWNPQALADGAALPQAGFWTQKSTFWLKNSFKKVEIEGVGLPRLDSQRNSARNPGLEVQKGFMATHLVSN